MRIKLQPGKSEYSEGEAARALGVSAVQFRTLLARHLDDEEAMNNAALMRFRPSDLLLLSMLETPPSPPHQ